MIKLVLENAQIVTLIFSLIVTLSTVVYAILTYALVKETRKMRMVQTEPNIEILIQPSKEWINLVYLFVKNIGQGPAYDVSFKLEYNNNDEGAEKIVADFLKTNFMNSGIKYLGPEQEYRTAHTSFLDSFEQKINANITVEVSYKSQVGKVIIEKFYFNMNEFKGLQQESYYIRDISNSLKKIQDALEKITSGFGKIRVDMYTQEDKVEENRRLQKIIKEESKKIKR